MNYYRNNIRHVKGDTYSSALEAVNEEVDSAYFTCRDSQNDDSNILFEKSLNNGISLVGTRVTEEGETVYQYAVRIAPADTKDIQSGTYFYDLQVGLNGDIFTIMKGKFIIEQDSSREED